MVQGTVRVVDDFVMAAVAGARRTPGRHKTGGVTPKPPATIPLSLVPDVLGLRFALPEALRRHFLRAVAAAATVVLLAAATSAWCSRHNPPAHRFPDVLQLPTLRRHVSRPVAAGVSLFFTLCIAVFRCTSLVISSESLDETHVTTVYKCASDGVQYSIATVTMLFFLSHPPTK